MAEVGYDLTRHHSKGLDEFAGRRFDAVVGMGCGDAGCPLVQQSRHEEWDIPDPKTLPPDRFRRDPGPDPE